MTECLESPARSRCVISIKGNIGEFDPGKVFFSGANFPNKGIRIWQCGDEFLENYVKGKIETNLPDESFEIVPYPGRITMEDLVKMFAGKSISRYHLFMLLIEITMKSIKGLSPSRILIFPMLDSRTGTIGIWTALNHPKNGWTIEPLIQDEDERLPWPPKFTSVVYPK